MIRTFLLIAFMCFLTSCGTTTTHKDEPLSNSTEQELTGGDNPEPSKQSSVFPPPNDTNPPPISNDDPLLIELRNTFSLDHKLSEQDVLAQISKYEKNPKQLSTILVRGSDYLPMLIDKVQARGLPSELALLPIVESGFNTRALSSAGAAGLWQLMPATARHLGLQIDWWIDERLDPEKSTDKALDYLQYLEKKFNGDWELVIAAYNGGEAHVRSRMRRAKSRDFWKLQLKRETRQYVPKLLALSAILKNPQQINFDIPLLPEPKRNKEILFDRQVDIRALAKSINLEANKLRYLNPQYKRWITPPDISSYVLVPVKKHKLIDITDSSLWAENQTSWLHYRVRSGDTLGEIAQAFETNIVSIQEINRLENHRIYPNQDLLIPMTDISGGKTNTSFISESYIVKRGDSLWKIARKNNTSIRNLLKLNNLSSSGRIHPGQKLTLQRHQIHHEISTDTHLVAEGDSLYGIAMRYKILVRQLLAWNDIDSSDYIYPGQTLLVSK